MNYYNQYKREEKTIVSLVTYPINQNIAIIRISGKETYRIVEKITKKRIKEEDRKQKILFREIFNKEEVLDQVLLLCFSNPRSFTGEDLVEISCHGNKKVVEKIISLILRNGAELALAGEFSKRSYFNGKINLIQANAINQLIKAENESSVKIALQNLDKEKRDKIENLENEIVVIIGNIEISIDYPEYNDNEKISRKNLINKLENFELKIESLIRIGENAKFYQRGINITIIGSPNVGKSTLLNSLIKEEKAIVSNIAGTTRDVVEGNYNINGIPINFYDTAGIRKTKNQIERKGIEKSKSFYKKTDLFLFVLDNSKK